MSAFVLDRFLQHIPEIERRIADNRLDSIVFGVGPTAWLLPWIDPGLLAPLRKWTSHDGCRIIPANDLVLMDPAYRSLHPDTVRYQHIVEARPDRIWCIDSAWDNSKKYPELVWSKHLHAEVLPRVTVQRWRVWNPTIAPHAIDPKLDMPDPKTGVILPDTCAISPAGACTLAWLQGCRRIGLLGVDMLPHHGHPSLQSHCQVDAFLQRIAQRMHEAGGQLVNLSPITSLKAFRSWTPSASSSVPTSGSVTPGPNKSSNTAFVLARPATFPLPGCEAATLATKSAS